MTRFQPLDAQQLLRLELQGISLIEASAGTGKTYTIANLYLRHILQGRKPAEILVVSFTNAATDELHQRIRTRLYQALEMLESLQAPADEFLGLLLEQHVALDQHEQTMHQQRLQFALRSMDEAAISTIHGFCQNALQDHALLSNRLFESELISDDDAFWNDALKDWWRRSSYPLSSAEWQLFNLAIPNLGKLLGWQKQMRSHPLDSLLPQPGQTLESLLGEWAGIEPQLLALRLLWQEHAHQLFEILRDTDVLKQDSKSPFKKILLDALQKRIHDYFDSTDLLPVVEQLRYLSAAQLEAYSRPGKLGQEPGFEHPFFIGVGSVFEQIDSISRRFKLSALLDAHAFAEQRVAQIKQQTRQLAYQDQLNLLLQALEQAHDEGLAKRLRERFPVAMIDEFQDTDPTQYRIFKHLYFASDDISLTLIGDPKQAIYSFRGGDIFTYIDARQAAGIRRYCLQTNWRSDPALIDAVNHLFLYRKQPFIYDQAIGFAAAQPAPREGSIALVVDNRTAVALSLWQIPVRDNGKTFAVGEIRKRLNLAVSAEISRLLDPSSAAHIGAKPLQSGDIAVLVRTAYEGEELRATLAEAGIRSVTIGKEKVFASDESGGLYALLDGVAHPTDNRCLRRARASHLFNFNYRQLAECFDDDSHWQHWIDQLLGLHECWVNRGFIAMFQQMLEQLELAKWLCQREFADRRLTNLLHLAELLQRQSRISPGIEALLGWFRLQVDGDPGDEAELRLESDDSLVKIVTVHKSKGLEYAVVFLPFLWHCKPVDAKAEILRYHDQDNRAVLDLGSDNFEQHRIIADKERLAEDLRLLYVALTRAKSKVFLAWGDVGDGRSKGRPQHSALAYLLHSKQTPEDLCSALPRGFESPAELQQGLLEFGKYCGGNIEIIDLPEAQPATAEVGAESQADEVQARTFAASPALSWRINSFSSLTREVHQVAHPGNNVSDNDPILDFPAGSHIGLMLHELLEHLDFQHDVEFQLQRLVAEVAPGYGVFDKDQQQTLIRWIQAVVNTGLGRKGLSLAALSKDQRLNELSFDFALDQLDIDALNQFLQEASRVRPEPISALSFRGLITGVIDLVFEFEGSYYLADYKSNFLGASLEDYVPERLDQAMLDRRYDLQSMLYSIALHRYLAQRLPDYDYDRHFGGSYYLFLRAMRPHSGARYGVHFHRPDLARLQKLDRLLAFTPVDAVSP